MSLADRGVAVMSSGVGEFHPRASSKSSEFAAFAVVLVPVEEASVML